MLAENVCLSGGADGADLQWGMTAGFAGHTVIHWSFAGHKTKAPAVEVVQLTPEQLERADERIQIARKTLNKSMPRKPWVANLIRRNWYQVETADRVYAVATIEYGLVTGGTAWACQMFMDRFDRRPCECYVYDQVQEQWFAWKGAWVAIISPPKPYGIWAGIGTRDLNDAGKRAIRTLMEWKKPDEATNP